MPELLVSDLATSLEFWCELCGFVVDYRREEDRFAYLSSGSAQVMLEQRGIGRNFITGPLEPPLGRGINFQIAVPELAPLLAALDRAGHSLFMAPETRWYRVDGEEAGVEQFLVTDPDGYLLRFQAPLGRRAAG